MNAVILPLLFISNVFIRIDGMTGWLPWVSYLFPVRHFADAMMTIYDPRTSGPGFAPDHLAWIAGWGVIGLVVASLRFRWEPRR